MDYIKEMRELVGTRPLLLPGSIVIVRNKSGKIILTRRADTREWSLPGGHMEPGESLEDTARREIREEIGLEVEDVRLFAVHSGPHLYYKYPNGDEIYKVTAVFTALACGEVYTLDTAEVTEAVLFDVDKLPDDLFSHERPMIEEYARSFSS